MTGNSNITVRLPTPVAARLAQHGQARLLAPRRSLVPELLADGALTGATLVTLMQAPSTIRAVAEAIRDWLSDTREADAPCRLTASGPSGRIELEVDPNTNLDTLATFLEQTIFQPRN
jgi:hypothetical protein